MIDNYCTDPGYISALASSVREDWQSSGSRSHLLMSFHGIPQACVTRGDRYADECQATGKALAEALQLSADQWSLSFQSRFGANRWLSPATEQTLKDLVARGVRELSVICPGFAADCLETLEEIAIEGRDTFLAAGGHNYRYVPALNDRPDHARALAQLLRRAATF